MQRSSLLTQSLWSRYPFSTHSSRGAIIPILCIDLISILGTNSFTLSLRSESWPMLPRDYFLLSYIFIADPPPSSVRFRRSRDCIFTRPLESDQRMSHTLSIRDLLFYWLTRLSWVYWIKRTTWKPFQRRRKFISTLKWGQWWTLHCLADPIPFWLQITSANSVLLPNWPIIKWISAYLFTWKFGFVYLPLQKTLCRW